jgi:two-component system NtrC family sensor kinase
MLQHTRVSTGKHELTDVNLLADKFLRLACQSFLAKDSAFMIATQTSFDNSIGKLSIVPQDIGRALLNIYNNAFYAVSEKLKHGNKNYQPDVSVIATKSDRHI